MTLVRSETDRDPGREEASLAALTAFARSIRCALQGASMPEGQRRELVDGIVGDVAKVFRFPAHLRGLETGETTFGRGDGADGGGERVFGDAPVRVTSGRV